MHTYDYIVIGSGLSGLTVAAKISQETKNILLLESETTLGGSNKSAILRYQDHAVVTENGLRFFPGGVMAEKALLNLENDLGLKLIRHTRENHPETYDAQGFKAFVGFGDHVPEFYDQMSYFLNPQEIELTLPVHKIIEQLQAKYEGETLTKSFVTAFNFTEGELTHITVNGSKQIYAKNFIFAGAVRDLAGLLPDEVLNTRAKTKLKKDTTWLGLCLDVLHEGASVDKTNLFVLEGTTQDAIGPCVGRFLPAENGLQVSQWMGFIDLDVSEETENIAEVLKKMKRQIKRAFPEMADNIKSERLFITPPLSGGELKLNANGTLPKAENLWVASGQVNKFPNLLGALLQAQFTLSSLGFGEAQIKTSSEIADEAVELSAKI